MADARCVCFFFVVDAVAIVNPRTLSPEISMHGAGGDCARAHQPCEERGGASGRGVWRAAAAMAGAVVLVGLGLAAAGRPARRGQGELLAAAPHKQAAMLRLAAKAAGAKAVAAAAQGKVQLELRDIEHRLQGTIRQLAPAAKKMALDEEAAPAAEAEAPAAEAAPAGDDGAAEPAAEEVCASRAPLPPRWPACAGCKRWALCKRRAPFVRRACAWHVVHPRRLPACSRLPQDRGGQDANVGGTCLQRPASAALPSGLRCCSTPLPPCSRGVSCTHSLPPSPPPTPPSVCVPAAWPPRLLPHLVHSPAPPPAGASSSGGTGGSGWGSGGRDGGAASSQWRSGRLCRTAWGMRGDTAC